MLQINNLRAKVEEKTILNGVSLNLEAGEVVAVMGKNGSGKSTLAYSVAGHPKYQLDGEKGVISVDGEDVTAFSPDERAILGLFLANQYPVAIAGLTVTSFLWQLYKKRNPSTNSGQARRMSIIEFREWLAAQAKSLDLNPDLLKRGLNDGFSGGEKKKLEILQLLVFNPKYVILDEIDSGLDVDALKKIAKTIAKVVKDRRIGVLVITHYNRILKYLIPDRVIIMDDGKIIREGKGDLAEEIEVSGYVND